MDAILEANSSNIGTEHVYDPKMDPRYTRTPPSNREGLAIVKQNHKAVDRACQLKMDKVRVTVRKLHLIFRANNIEVVDRVTAPFVIFITVRKTEQLHKVVGLVEKCIALTSIVGATLLPNAFNKLLPESEYPRGKKSFILVVGANSQKSALGIQNLFNCSEFKLSSKKKWIKATKECDANERTSSISSNTSTDSQKEYPVSGDRRFKNSNSAEDFRDCAMCLQMVRRGYNMENINCEKYCGHFMKDCKPICMESKSPAIKNWDAVMVQPGKLGVQCDINGLITGIAKDAPNEIKRFTGWRLKFLDNEIFTDKLFEEKQNGFQAYKIAFAESRSGCVSRSITSRSNTNQDLSRSHTRHSTSSIPQRVALNQAPKLYKVLDFYQRHGNTRCKCVYLNGIIHICAECTYHDTNSASKSAELGIIGMEPMHFEALQLKYLVQMLEVQHLASQQMNWITGSQFCWFSEMQIKCLKAEQLAGLSKDHIQSMSRRQIQALLPYQIKLLSQYQISYFSTEQITYLSPRQIGALKSSQINSLNPKQIQSILPSQISCISILQIPALSHTVISLLPPEKIAYLRSDQIASLTNDQIQLLSGKQIAATSQISSFSPEQTFHFKPEQIAGLNLVQVSSLTPDQISVFTDTQMPAFTIQQIAFFTTIQIKAITIDQIRTLSAQQISNFSLKQIQAFTTEQIQNLVHEQIQKLTIGQISALTNDQVSSLTPEQITSLTNQQIPALTKYQIPVLTPAQILALTPKQISAFTVSQIPALTNEQVELIEGDDRLSGITPLQTCLFTERQVRVLSDHAVRFLLSIQRKCYGTMAMCNALMARGKELEESGNSQKKISTKKEKIISGFLCINLILTSTSILVLAILFCHKNELV